MPWEIYDPANPNENVFFGGSDVISQRYILTLNGVNSYIDLNQVWEPVDTSSFKISLNLSGVLNNTTEEHIIDYSADLFCKITVSVNGNILALVGNGSAWIVGLVSLTAVDDGGEYFIEVEKTNNNYVLKVDGVTESEVIDASAITPKLSKIGQMSNSSNHLNGAVYNVSLTADGVTNFYPIDDNSTTVIRNAGSGADATPINVTQSMWSLINV